MGLQLLYDTQHKNKLEFKEEFCNKNLEFLRAVGNWGKEVFKRYSDIIDMIEYSILQSGNELRVDCHLRCPGLLPIRAVFTNILSMDGKWYKGEEMGDMIRSDLNLNLRSDCVSFYKNIDRSAKDLEEYVKQKFYRDWNDG